MISRRNLKKLSNAPIGNNQDWNSKDTAKAFAYGLKLVAKQMIQEDD